MGPPTELGAAGGANLCQSGSAGAVLRNGRVVTWQGLTAAALGPMAAMVPVPRGQNRRRLTAKRRRHADPNRRQRSPAALAAVNGFVGAVYQDGGGWRRLAALPARRGRAGSWRAPAGRGVYIAGLLAQIALLTHLTSPQGDAFRHRYAPRDFFDTPLARSQQVTVEADPLSQKNGRKNRKKS